MSFEHFAIITTLIGAALVAGGGGMLFLEFLSRWEATQNSKLKTKNSEESR